MLCLSICVCLTGGGICRTLDGAFNMAFYAPPSKHHGLPILGVDWHGLSPDSRSMRVCELIWHGTHVQTSLIYFALSALVPSAMCKTSSSGKDLVYEGVPSVSVLWMKIGVRCVAAVVCFSAHQGLDCFGPDSSTSTTNVLRRMAAQQKK